MKSYLRFKILANFTPMQILALLQVVANYMNDTSRYIYLVESDVFLMKQMNKKLLKTEIQKWPSIQKTLNNEFLTKLMMYDNLKLAVHWMASEWFLTGRVWGYVFMRCWYSCSWTLCFSWNVSCCRSSA